MRIMRRLAMGIGVCAALSGSGWATTLSYQSDSIIEFDMFQQWWGSGGFLSNLPGPPQRANSARLLIDFNEPLADLTSYTIGKGPGAGAIAGYSLSVETDRGRYGVGGYLAGNFEMTFQTGAVGQITGWEVDWHINGADMFDLQGSGSSDQVSWDFEYYETPADIFLQGARGNASDDNVQLVVFEQDQSGPPPLPAVPLPATALLLLGGLAALTGMSRVRTAGG